MLISGSLFQIILISRIFIFIINKIPMISSKSCSGPIDPQFRESQIILFFAPIDDYDTRKQIVLYWSNPYFRSGDSVALFYFKNGGLCGRNRFQASLLFEYFPYKPSGFIETKVKPIHLTNSNITSFKKTCTGYYGVWRRNSRVKNFHCLSTQPNWMYENEKILCSKRLGDIFIPGTHDSGAYKIGKPTYLAEKYTITQSSSILEQLIHGVRYLDLRPNKSHGYWINHGSIRINPLNHVIKDIKLFLDNTNEIIIVDFREFPTGFNSKSDHITFVEYLEKKFSGYYYKRNYRYSRTDWSKTTLNDIWNSNRRLIICYNHHGIHETGIDFWDSPKHLWANTANINDLKEYFHRVDDFLKMTRFTGYVSVPRASMAELTFSTWDIIKDSAKYAVGIDDKSLRKNAALVGPQITQWFNEEFTSTVNIVAVDFVEVTGIVDVAIEWNKRKFSAFHYDYNSTMIHQL